ncbi:hypothetical protein BpHYR1_046309 [Brachionus plicatilis]|uniref:TRPM tetramerisation domain-containing protein n=1 Tax=Brachionus plicatilis TaxID=10195 RepID=A0A3M7SG19_BRAPC|nr:hypothetical protein BpHYR1_046309 [Brachionus plicatilis]
MTKKNLLQVESISARIDDIFFKENMTKLSLYKVELRLQKLEEFAYETMEKINVIANSLSSKNSEQHDLLNTSQYSLLNRSRRRNITVCESFDRSHLHPISSVPARMSRSPVNSTKYMKSISNIENGLKNKNNSMEKKSELEEIINAEERRKKFSEPCHSDAKSSEFTEANKAQVDLKSSLEEEYLKKQSGLKKSNNLSESSLDSVNRADNLGDTTKESDSDTSDDDEPGKILKSIYTSKPDGQHEQNSCEIQTGLDQYTLHPFVYLHPVIKPPLAEYTSITDCIDTSNIDRPPSPSILNKSGVLKLNESANKFNHAKMANLNDYCSNDTARSAVARQESEILRLAEESQHVIISQMLNQIVKTDESGSQKSRDDDRHSPIFNLEGDKSPEKMPSPTNNKKPPFITFNTGSDIEEEDTMNCAKNSKLVVNEEDETGKLPSFKNNKYFSSMQKPFKKTNFKQNSIPLSMLDRNSSQIFYAQSQANVLCSNESEREEENNLKD